MARLVEETEKARDALLIEAARSANPPPLPQTAVERLNQLGVAVPGNAVAA
jgi:1-acyl-sn-glycerol-3-phosphate acyltransferase